MGVLNSLFSDFPIYFHRLLFTLPPSLGNLRCTKRRYLVVHPTNRKWVITLVIDGISGVSPLITRVITHLLNVMHKMKIDIDLENCQF